MTADKDELLRERFEKWITAPPFEKDVSRYGETGTYWPGCYEDYQVHLAWDAWKESARITAALAEKDKGGCKWSPDDDFELGDTWHGECGAIWTFTEGGPAENTLKFCPECGGSVSLPPLPKGDK